MRPAYRSMTEVMDDEGQRQILIDPDLDSPIKESLIQARRGQGKFRAKVEAIGRSCRITGVATHRF